MQHVRLEKASEGWLEQGEEAFSLVVLVMQAVSYLVTSPLLRAPLRLLARLEMQVRPANSLASARFERAL